MLGSALDDIARGWIAGIIVGTLIARRAERRGAAIDRDGVIERWSLFGASLGAGYVLCVNLF